jgi:hypothetical protein
VFENKIAVTPLFSNLKDRGTRRFVLVKNKDGSFTVHFDHGLKIANHLRHLAKTFMLQGGHDACLDQHRSHRQMWEFVAEDFTVGCYPTSLLEELSYDLLKPSALDSITEVVRKFKGAHPEGKSLVLMHLGVRDDEDDLSDEIIDLTDIRITPGDLRAKRAQEMEDRRLRDYYPGMPLLVSLAHSLSRGPTASRTRSRSHGRVTRGRVRK